jgi:exosortase/archaeosortase family protein
MTISLRRFIIAAFVLVGGAMVLARGDAFEALQARTAAAGAWVAGVFGAQTTVLGSTIVTSSGPLDVVNTCLPLGITAVFAALVISTETSAKRRIAGLLAALAIVLAANVVRVAVAVWAAQSNAEAFDYLHRGLLQMLPEAFVFIPWLVWSGTGHRREALTFAAWVAGLSVAFSFAWPMIESGFLAFSKAFPAASGAELQPVGASPWLVTGIAVLVAARASLPRRAVAVLSLIAIIAAFELALRILTPALGLSLYDQTSLRSSLTFMAPLVAVVFFAHGRLSGLWAPETEAVV